MHNKKIHLHNTDMVDISNFSMQRNKYSDLKKIFRKYFFIKKEKMRIDPKL